MERKRKGWRVVVGEGNNKKKQRILKQILFMEAKLCHFILFMEAKLCCFILFGPQTPSKAVQGPMPHWHLLLLFLEEGGCGQTLVGTCQDLQPCAKAKATAWLLPVAVLSWAGWESQ